MPPLGDLPASYPNTSGLDGLRQNTSLHMLSDAAGVNGDGLYLLVRHRESRFFWVRLPTIPCCWFRYNC
jgi:hypothetical protein